MASHKIGRIRHWTKMTTLPSGTPAGAKVGSTWELDMTDVRGTLTYALGQDDAAVWRGTLLYQKTIGHADLTAAAVTEAISFTDALPTGNVAQAAAWINLGTEFSGGTVSALTAQLGPSADPNLLMAATSIFTAAGTGNKQATPGIALDGTQSVSIGSGSTLEVLFTATGDNVVNLDAGSLTAFAQIEVT